MQCSQLGSLMHDVLMMWESTIGNQVIFLPSEDMLVPGNAGECEWFVASKSQSFWGCQAVDRQMWMSGKGSS